MSQTTTPSKILLPLYIYPHPGAWEPIYTAYSVLSFPHLHPSTYTSSITVHRDLQFLVIVNPNSGPGAAPWWPNEDYIREIPRLNALRNVTTLGYVRVTYCKRDLEETLEDIETYAGRGRKDDGARVDGIFVDETVNIYSKEAKLYLDAIDRKVEESIGVAGNRLVGYSYYHLVLSEISKCTDRGSGHTQPRHSREPRPRKPRTRHHSRCRNLSPAVQDSKIPTLVSHFTVRPPTDRLYGALGFGRRGRFPYETVEGAGSVSIRDKRNV
jgi:hypothetical protein